MPNTTDTTAFSYTELPSFDGAPAPESAPAPAGRTVGDLMRAHLARLEARRRETTHKKAKYMWKSTLIPWLGARRPIDEVTRGQVQAWLDLPEQARRPAHADNAVAVGRAAYNMAIRLLEWAERNPFVGVELYERRPRTRVLSEAEIRSMYAWLATEKVMGSHPSRRHAARAIRCLSLTGARRGEVLFLDWSEVDLEGSVIVLPPERHKTGQRTGRPKSIYLPPEACALLRSLGPQESGRVFKCSYGTLRRTFERMREEIGAPDITMHDLRRTWSTALAEAGVDVADVAAVLGQTSVVQARHYRHLRADRLRALAEQAGRLMS